MGRLFILSAPSGTGKSTVAGKLLQQVDSLRRVVTATTRRPRPGEKDGVDYIFMTREEFERGIKEEVLSREYLPGGVRWLTTGTPRDQVERNMKENVDSLLVIDVQGAFRVKEVFQEAVSVFLLPPSLEELKRRMIARGYRDSNTEVRLEMAKKEIPCARFFDYVIINDFVDRAVELLRSIILASRCERERVLGRLDALLHSEDVLSLLKGGRCYVKEA
ncbi:MAG: guanylate kinase [Aquificota bacterium]|nr:guanylate kinase [Aquificota bacterium]